MEVEKRGEMRGIMKEWGEMRAWRGLNGLILKRGQVGSGRVGYNS